MRGANLLLCGSISLLGIISAALGFVAESRHVKADQVTNINGHCIYPKTPALALGIISAFTILLAQVLSNLSGGCICCKRGVDDEYLSNSSRAVGTLCLVMSWITFFNAFALLLAGASLQKQFQNSNYWFGRDCYVVKPGVFAGGALLALATAVLGIIYHFITCDLKKATRIGPQEGVTHGQPYGFQTHFPLVPQSYQHQPPYFQYPRHLQIPHTMQCPPSTYPSYAQGK